MKRLLLITLVFGGATFCGCPEAAHAGNVCGNGGYTYSAPGYSYYATSPNYATSHYGSGLGFGYSQPVYAFNSPGIGLSFNRGYNSYHNSHFHNYGRWGGGVGSANFHHFHHH